MARLSTDAFFRMVCCNFQKDDDEEVCLDYSKIYSKLEHGEFKHSDSENFEMDETITPNVVS